MSMNRSILGLGALLLALAIGIGAFGAHLLKDQLSPASLEIYKTGQFYHVIAAFGIMLLALFSAPKVHVWLQSIGLILFSGSLYALALTGIGIFGAITPLGGVAWITSWLMLAWWGFRSSNTEG